MPDPLTIHDAWIAMRDHIGTLPAIDPEDGDGHGMAADTFRSLTNAWAGGTGDPDAELRRSDLPDYLASDDVSTWFPLSRADDAPIPAVLVRWIHANLPVPAWVPPTAA